jgi:uncharacterized protein YPO0396
MSIFYAIILGMIISSIVTGIFFHSFSKNLRKENQELIKDLYYYKDRAKHYENDWRTNLSKIKFYQRKLNELTIERDDYRDLYKSLKENNNTSEEIQLLINRINELNKERHRAVNAANQFAKALGVDVVI